MAAFANAIKRKEAANVSHQGKTILLHTTHKQ